MSEGWRCSVENQDWIDVAFVADPHLRNLADRLAHRFSGTSLNATEGHIQTQRLIVLTTGIGIVHIKANLARVDARETLVIGVGVSGEVLEWALEGAQYTTIPSAPDTLLWRAAQDAVDGVRPWSDPQSRPRLFLSHGVADEGILFPAVEALRALYGLSIFLCADSITPGSKWQSEIQENLQACDLFVLVNSDSVQRSTYCAFEVGYASALGTPMRVMSLDETAVPAYLSDIQAPSVPRLLERHPWLNRREAIFECLLSVISSAQPVASQPKP